MSRNSRRIKHISNIYPTLRSISEESPPIVHFAAIDLSSPRGISQPDGQKSKSELAEMASDDKPKKSKLCPFVGKRIMIL